jgi:hypothetical protein
MGVLRVGIVALLIAAATLSAGSTTCAVAQGEGVCRQACLDRWRFCIDSCAQREKGDALALAGCQKNCTIKKADCDNRCI